MSFQERRGNEQLRTELLCWIAHADASLKGQCNHSLSGYGFIVQVSQPNGLSRHASCLRKKLTPKLKQFHKPSPLKEKKKVLCLFHALYQFLRGSEEQQCEQKGGGGEWKNPFKDSKLA